MFPALFLCRSVRAGGVRPGRRHLRTFPEDLIGWDVNDVAVLMYEYL